MTEVMKVKRLIDGIRVRICENVMTEDNMGGCLQNTVEHYIDTFDSQIDKLKAQLHKNLQNLQKQVNG